MLSTFYADTFSLDNRFFRTMRQLLVPGRLTTLYLTGRQQPYFQPLRLFFVSGLLMIGVYGAVASTAIGDSLERSTENKRSEAYQKVYSEKLIGQVDSVRLAFPQAIVRQATDSLIVSMGRIENDSTELGYLDFSQGLGGTTTPFIISDQDYILLTPEEIVTKYGITGRLNRYQVKQLVRLNRMNLSDVNKLIGQLIWGLLVMVPISALLLKVVYIRRKKKYVAHFVFSLHTHSFLFLTHFLGACELAIFGTPYLIIFGTLASIVYFVLSLKKVYQQGWWRTLIKAFLLMWAYLFLLQLVAFVTLLTWMVLF
ncbi:DUF3667 domain-containing protein [Neolewinella lacunae]|uniref:DUF3667 domain-containing protein n=1 Tax=Neolewinella lacunae TaxID=1517758 RepID=A0A923PMS2_9BACT|nr:DUF3667 domain-containing protein [Neolewinella lacunae]MBC6994546.1 DUF3667 domain-containing protein [Neolewinella lacunae]MDN3634239.1 DUF3667 domain-containing protein [Neolewinella lacunae]